MLVGVLLCAFSSPLILYVGRLIRVCSCVQVILVDHKLDVVEGVDRVICLHEGRVVEDGRAVELLERGGGYVNALFRQTSSPE